MESVRDVIFTRLFPILAVIGVGFAAVSLYTGNPNAKTHVVYAIMASILLFGAQGIIDLIKSTVN
jgi:prepilin signal peptidase PulO-like enzyme (type II secretory pathway)